MPEQFKLKSSKINFLGQNKSSPNDPSYDPFNL